MVLAHCLRRVVVAATCVAAGASSAAEPVAWRRAADRGSAFLAMRQAADGGWRSDTYGNFRGGDALTPLALIALDTTTHPGPHAAGCRFLANLAADPERIDRLEYPVYTAAFAVQVCLRDEASRGSAIRWADVLRGQQLAAGLGWAADDPEFGGWGYATVEPRKPRPGAVRLPTLDPNLSATTLAVTALRTGGARVDDPALRAALTFLERCQNVPRADAAADPAFDDGGFCFDIGVADRSKAGSAGVDRHGRMRLRSYGSATADGLRALLACGLPADHPRVAAARAWLERQFAADTHPGAFPRDRHVFRDGCFYYWCWSVATTLEALGVDHLHTTAGPLDWRRALAEALVERQADDGSWRSVHGAVREDDPLVATPLALATLRMCSHRTPRQNTAAPPR